MVVLLNMDSYPGVEHVDATSWVDQPVQLTGKLVQIEGRAVDLDPYDCIEAFNSERCRLPVWWINPDAASANPTAVATTQRQVLIPPAAGTSTATFRGIPVLFRMAIVDFFGTERVVTDEAEIEAVVPWPIVLPSYLPPGYDKIGLLQVHEPMQNLPADAVARTTRIQIGFTGGPQVPGFMLILSGGHVGTDGTEQVLVNGQPAKYGVNTQGAQNLAWDLCGRTLSLGALERDLPKDELIRIAESAPEQCE